MNSGCAPEDNVTLMLKTERVTEHLSLHDEILLQDNGRLSGNDFNTGCQLI
jgi:hypothetical protein